MSQNKQPKAPGRQPRQKRQPRLTSRKRETVDTSLIALCYWLMAQRLVEEAEANGEFDCPEPDAHDPRPEPEEGGQS